MVSEAEKYKDDDAKAREKVEVKFLLVFYVFTLSSLLYDVNLFGNLSNIYSIEIGGFFIRSTFLHSLT